MVESFKPRAQDPCIQMYVRLSKGIARHIFLGAPGSAQRRNLIWYFVIKE